MSTSSGINVLAILLSLLVFIVLVVINTCINHFIKHMNTYEISHFSIHNFALKKLKSEIELIWGTIRIVCLNLHIVKVDFTFANTGSHVVVLLWFLLGGRFWLFSANIIGRLRLGFFITLAGESFVLFALKTFVLKLDCWTLSLQNFGNLGVRKKLLDLLLSHFLQNLT